MVLDRASRRLQLTQVSHLPDLLNPGDLLVLNDSRVIPARLRATKVQGGGRLEILLLESLSPLLWTALVRPGKRVRPGTLLGLVGSDPPPQALVEAKAEDGVCHLRFPEGTDVLAFAERHGEVPLPPYIRRTRPQPEDRSRYQTVYARIPGSVAAPTAGLHFTPELLHTLAQRGIQTCAVTLHVGLGTFAPVKTETLRGHAMHTERLEVSPESAARIEEARKAGRRVVAVGTTALRVLESVARVQGGRVVPGTGRTDLFLFPPAEFHVVGALLTNFHLPRSTLLMLVSAFAAPGRTDGREFVLAAYQRAVEERFRFFSYGDAMLIQ